MKIVTTGFVSDRELSALYRGARVFLHFSLSEGFNIPLVQAMTTALPVLVSDIPVHHEIARDSALYVDPGDETALKEAMTHIWHDEALRRTLSQHAQEYAPTFSWDTSATQHVALITS